MPVVKAARGPNLIACSFAACLGMPLHSANQYFQNEPVFLPATAPWFYPAFSRRKSGAFLNRFSWNCCYTMPTSLSIPRRKSVYPQAIQVICLSEIAQHSLIACRCSFPDQTDWGFYEADFPFCCYRLKYFSLSAVIYGLRDTLLWALLTDFWSTFFAHFHLTRPILPVGYHSLLFYNPCSMFYPLPSKKLHFNCT